jgi:anti-sigma regulatory factor (Ser/Thr protein kinase)
VNGVAALAGGAPPPNDESFAVGLPGLAALREQVTRKGHECGLTNQRINDLVLVANELTSNVVRHGGGTGSMRLWHDENSVYCQVSDAGSGMADPAGVGRQPSRPDAVTGRGLWMIRQLADEVRIDSGPTGTTVTVRVARAAR